MTDFSAAPRPSVRFPSTPAITDPGSPIAPGNPRPNVPSPAAWSRLRRDIVWDGCWLSLFERLISASSKIKLASMRFVQPRGAASALHRQRSPDLYRPSLVADNVPHGIHAIPLIYIKYPMQGFLSMRI